MVTFAVAPHIIAAYGWPAMFHMYGIIGFVWVFLWQQMPIDNRKGQGKSAGQEGQSSKQLLHSMEKGGETEKSSTDIDRLLLMKTAASDRKESDGEQVMVLSLPLLRRFFASKSLCAIVFAQFCNNFGQQVLLVWMPTYFHDTFGVEMKNLSMTAFPYLAMALSVNVGGLLADRLVQRGMPLTTVRKLLTAVGFGGSSILLLGFAMAPSLQQAVLFLW